MSNTTTAVISSFYYHVTSVTTQLGGKAEFIGKQHDARHFISYLNSFGYMMK